MIILFVRKIKIKKIYMQPPFFVKWNNMVHIWFNLEKIMFIPIKKVVVYMMTSRMQSYCKLHLLLLL